jgi:hypothetical protein
LNHIAEKFFPRGRVPMAVTSDDAVPERMPPRRGWFRYYATCFLNRKARFETGLPALADVRPIGRVMP